MATTQPKVLIAGAGPTGMMAALELSRLGIPVRIIEKADAPATTSRAIGVQARTLELFQQRGLADAMLAKGNPGAGASVYDRGQRNFRLDFAHNGSRYGYILFISQAETEAILRDALQKQGVAIERETEMVAVGQADHAGSVTAALRRKDGSLEAVVTDYLIVAEGAHSIARTTLGMQFKGKALEENYALGDCYIDGDLADTDVHIFSSVHGFLGLFPMGDHHFRMIASNPLSKPSKDTAPSLQELQAIYDQRSQIPARFHDLSWSSWFRINSRMIDKLHTGRIFFGGDSAHIHSPAGGQGMNTGIQDMVNLGWKLAMVIRGDADAKLLETYDQDRIPVIQSVLHNTENLTGAIGSENPVFRSVFDHLTPWIVGTQLVQENSTERMSQLSLNYRKSPLSVSQQAVGDVHAGDRLPDLTVIGGDGQIDPKPEPTTLLNLCKPDRFTLLFAQVASPEAMHRQVEDRLFRWKHLMEGHAVAAAPGEEAAFAQLFGKHAAVVLVRPDGYVAFTGSDTSLEALSDYLGGWFPPQAASGQEEKVA